MCDELLAEAGRHVEEAHCMSGSANFHG